QNRWRGRPLQANRRCAGEKIRTERQERERPERMAGRVTDSRISSERGRGGGRGEQSTVKPYYEASGITIYHGDCREILPTLPDDLAHEIVTDPPYGVQFQSSW